jgi:hypothetical protein
VEKGNPLNETWSNAPGWSFCLEEEINQFIDCGLSLAGLGQDLEEIGLESRNKDIWGRGIWIELFGQ